MEPLCEYCGVVRAVVYCKPDYARLCLSCDNTIHSANALSRRHPRSLLCDKCNSEPGMYRCMDEKLCICQICLCFDNGCSVLGHRLYLLQFYLGCPSLGDFSRLWSSILDLPLPYSAGLKVDEPRDEGSLVLGGNKLRKQEPWVGESALVPGGSSSIPPDRYFTSSCCKDEAPFFPDEIKPSKVISLIFSIVIHQSQLGRVV